MLKITMNTINQVKKEGTKTVWETIEENTSIINEEHYNNCTCDDTLRFFRRLGGSETLTRSYTKCGYLVTKLVSTSPDKQKRTIREFSFELVNPSFIWGLEKALIDVDVNKNTMEILWIILRQSANRENHVIDKFSHLEIEGNIMTIIALDGSAFNVDLRPETLGGLC